MKLGERLQKERNKLNITQSEVAEKLKVSRQTISNWETSKSYPDLESLVLLSDYYNISLDVLLKEDDGMIKDVNKKLKFVGILKWTLCLCCIIFCVVYGISTIALILRDDINFNSGKSIMNIYFIVGIIKVILLFLLSFYAVKSLTTNTSKNYKIEAIISGLLLVFSLLTGEVNAIRFGNFTLDDYVIYIVLIFAFVQLYSISKDNGENTEKLKRLEDK
ncbi:Helix-turn-helix domain-containing protein [Anaerosphaera aminiphila DSM 21120]|uniref:Helix-turn-helix domain-containing protein n=1 Tax=Anaerosphaera aminiphila DSM 21120 TaxID=1120995 RepID=A0A1M5TFX4_9FIRM|nr:helix-turn-helix transcriptional regulator [Anaerosphaera aminiphila]SHH49616.1 Helix-turn-helix domain-containing protein [Anaerosphaera aminiphila DSM 21120]